MRKYLLVAAFSLSALLFGNVSAQADSPLLDFVEEYFESYNTENFEAACGMLSPYKCDPKSVAGVARFSQEYNKMSNGYEEVSLWVPEIPEEQQYDIVCVENTYQYSQAADENMITEVMSYYVYDTEDGDKEIMYRVCENKMNSNGIETSCPVMSAMDYCMARPSKMVKVENIAKEEEMEEIEMPAEEMVEDEEIEIAIDMENKEMTIEMLLEEIEGLKEEIEKLEGEVVVKEEQIVVLEEEIEQDAEMAVKKAEEDAAALAEKEAAEAEALAAAEELAAEAEEEIILEEAEVVAEEEIVADESEEEVDMAADAEETVEPTEEEMESEETESVESTEEATEETATEEAGDSEILDTLSEEEVTTDETMEEESTEEEAPEENESARAEPQITEIEAGGMRLVITEYNEA